MADSASVISSKNSEKSKLTNLISRTTSETLRLNDIEKVVNSPNSLSSAPRKKTSFQITSVIVASRASNDGGDDSADDLDESHAEDISEVLDNSRITDLENETPSYSEDTFSKDDVFFNASSSLVSAPVIPTSSQYGLAIVATPENSESALNPSENCVNSDSVDGTGVDETEVTSANVINLGVVSTKHDSEMRDMHPPAPRTERFKVVKIESTEPFKRGRWVCMDYFDHTIAQKDQASGKTENTDSTGNNTIDTISTVVTDQSPGVNSTAEEQSQTTVPPEVITNPAANMQPNDSNQVSNNQVPISSTPAVVPTSYPSVSPGQSLQNNIQMGHLINSSAPPQQTQQSQSLSQVHMQQILANSNQHQSLQPQQIQQVLASANVVPMQQQPPQQTPIQQTMQQPQQQSVMQQPMQQMHQPSQQFQSQQQSIPQQQNIQQQSVTTQQQSIPQQQQPIHQQQSLPQQQQTMPQQQPTMSQQQQQQSIQQQQPQQTQSTISQQQAQQSIPQQQQQVLPQQQTMPQQQQQSMPQQQQQIPQQPQQIPQQQQQQIPQQQQQQQQQPQQIPQQQQQPQQIPQQQQQQQGMPQQQQTMPQQQFQPMQQQQQQPMMQQQIPQQQLQNQIPVQQVQMQPNVQQIPMQQQQNPQSMQQQQMMQQPMQQMQQQQQPSQMHQVSYSQPMQQTQQPIMTQTGSQQQVPGMMQQMHPQQMQGFPQGQIMTNIQQSQPIMNMQSQPHLQPQYYPTSQPMSSGIVTSQPGMMSQGTMPQVSMPGSTNLTPLQTYASVASLPPMGQVPNMPQTPPLPTSVQYSMPHMAQSGQPMNMPPMSMPQTILSQQPPPQQPPQPAQSYAGISSPAQSYTHGMSSSSVPSAIMMEHTLMNGDHIENPTAAFIESLNEVTASGDDIPQGEDSESLRGLARALTEVAIEPLPQVISTSGANAVAIDNKIEQAMDLVKSHLMYAVREEVEVLKEKIAELMERISQLEAENATLRAGASPETLALLPPPSQTSNTNNP